MLFEKLSREDQEFILKKRENLRNHTEIPLTYTNNDEPVNSEGALKAHQAVMDSKILLNFFEQMDSEYYKGS